MGNRGGLDVLSKNKSLALTRIRSADSPARSIVAIPTALTVIVALSKPSRCVVNTIGKIFIYDAHNN